MKHTAQRTVIRGGTIIDGTGAAPFEGDVAIEGARIVEVGKVTRGGDEEIDARGMIVTPGFVDVHTHYDGQVTWTERLAPSAWHGVTTAAMGNCGVGFAPCAPAHRDMLIELMEGIEDIPEIVLKAGLPWTWQSFPEYLDALAARHYDADLVAHLPHAPLRVHVMGERALRREAATTEDCAAMARLAGEALAAGACGFSSSRAIAHKTRKGAPTPTLTAAEDELTAIALAVGATGRGVLQFITDISEKPVEGAAEFAMLRRITEKSGRPMSINITQRENDPPGYQRVLDMISAANAAGTPITGQVMGRGIGLIFGFEVSDHPFSKNPSWALVANLPFAERVAALRDPALRARLLAEQPAEAGWTKRAWNFERTFELADTPFYEPGPEHSLAARARALGIAPAELAYDLMLADNGRGMLYRPLLNYANGNLDDVHNMLTHPHTVPGIADGGAHCAQICDASITTFSLAYWTRDRQGAHIALPKLVKGHTLDSARVLGLTDRGAIKPGWKADLNVIDYDHLALSKPRVAYDMPAGGKRLVQSARGYVATLVSGVVTRRDDQGTDALPGRLQRFA